MPIFEYRCRACRRKTTALVLVRSRETDVRCVACGSANLEKLYSRFATPKSEEARLEGLADSDAFANVDENDPSSVRRMMQRMGREMGEDFSDLEGALDEEMANEGRKNADASDEV
jgi:putative FmdB family regulatory protein